MTKTACLGALTLALVACTTEAEGPIAEERIASVKQAVCDPADPECQPYISCGQVYYQHWCALYLDWSEVCVSKSFCSNTGVVLSCTSEKHCAPDSKWTSCDALSAPDPCAGY